MKKRDDHQKLNKDDPSLTLSMGRIFHVVIEQDEDGMYVGRVPELQGCLSQGASLDELMKNIREAIELCLEVKAEEEPMKFIGVQEVEVV